MSFYSKNFDKLKIDKTNYILKITLNDPDVSNALSTTLIENLCIVLEHADFDKDIRVIILTGMGKNFCAGGNVKDMKTQSGIFEGDSNDLRRSYVKWIQRTSRMMESLETPIIAMVNGAAVGAGCDLACMCDIRVGTTSTKFMESFSSLSLVPGDGGTFFLSRVIGYSRAMEMFLTSMMVDGALAEKWGLLNYCVSDMETKVMEIAENISKKAPIALGLTKKALKQAQNSELNNHLDVLASFQGIAQRTNDHFEGVDALLEKRSADFKSI